MSNIKEAAKVKDEKKEDDINNNSASIVAAGGLTLTASTRTSLEVNAPVIAASNDHGTPDHPPAPNSKPREQDPAPIETYVYRDFASAEPSTINTGTSHERMPPQSLQSQKLPSKLAAMLSDPDLTSVITWMPHGRSWKILNRELFASFALPRYFGHSNHASFVRIVNAWGFRRISIGVDRDSYFHELFLRGKPNLHRRMKRLPSCHRKTPVDKDDKCPDFYELAKTSPLPEITWSTNASNQISGGFIGAGGGAAFTPGLNHAGIVGGRPYMPDTVKPIHYGDATGAFSSSAMNGMMAGGMGSGVGMGGGGLAANNSSFGMAENPMMSMLGMNGHLSGNGNPPQQPPTDASSLNAYTQSLQRENENLMLKIKLLEYENQAKQIEQQHQPQQQLQQLQQHLQQQPQQQPQQQQQWSTGNTNQQINNNLTDNNAATSGGVNMGFMGNMTNNAAAPSYNPSLPDKVI